MHQFIKLIPLDIVKHSLLFIIVFLFNIAHAMHDKAQGHAGRSAIPRDTIMWCAQNNDIASVERWIAIDPGAITRLDNRKENALVKASRNNNEAMARLLVKTGENHGLIEQLLLSINLRGEVPLSTASALGHTGIVRILVGAAVQNDVMKKMLEHEDPYKEIPFSRALSEGHGNVALLLMEKARACASRMVLCTNKQGITSLMNAVILGDPHIVSEILRDAQNLCNAQEFAQFINAQNQKGRTALHMALRYTEGALQKGRSHHSEDTMAAIITQMLAYPDVNVVAFDHGNGNERATAVFWASYLNKQKILGILAAYIKDKDEATKRTFERERSKGKRVRLSQEHRRLQAKTEESSKKTAY
jgi:ankyrin repeat protein